MVAVGIIGTGGIARAHAPGWLSYASSISLFSLEGAESFAHHLQERQHRRPHDGHPPIPVNICETLGDVLASVDVVDICTPTDTHASLVRTALDADCDVLCEKPLARTCEDALIITELAHQRGRILYPAHVVRFFPAYRQARTAIHHGSIGELAICRFRRAGSYPSWSSWFSDEVRSGGLAMDLAIHDLDQALWIAGPVDCVYATLSHTEGGSSFPIEMLDCTLTHHNGALSQVQAIWGPEGMRFCTEFSLSGTEGALTYSSLNDAPITTNGGESGTTIIPSVSGPSPYTGEIEDFLLARKNPAHCPVVQASDGVNAIVLAQAVKQSIDEHRPINREEWEVAR